MQERLNAGVYDAVVQHAMLVQLPNELDYADSALPRLHMCTRDETRTILAIAAWSMALATAQQAAWQCVCLLDSHSIGVR